VDGFIRGLTTQPAQEFDPRFSKEVNSLGAGWGFAEGGGSLFCNQGEFFAYLVIVYVLWAVF
jgi:hypothetical protein